AQKRPRCRELPPLGLDPAPAGARQLTTPPALGDELVEQDQHPAQAKQRQQGGEPGLESTALTVDTRDGAAEMPAPARIERPAGMQQDIGRQLHGIVPAEILEVDERERSVRAAQAVVKAEIGGDQTAPFLR